MNRTHLVSDVQLDAIRSEMLHLDRFRIITPDSDASFKAVIGIIDSIRGQ